MKHPIRLDIATPSLAPKLATIDASWCIEGSALERQAKHRITAAGNLGSAGFKLNSPVILREEAIGSALDLASLPIEAHSRLASCVQSVGGAMVATAEDLALVPLREIPFRIEPVYPCSMPSMDAILSSDAIELQLGDWTANRSLSHTASSLRSLQVAWPIDTPDLMQLSKKIRFIRWLAQNVVPVGVAIPMSEVSEASLESCRWLTQIEVDFVTIRTAAACLGSRHPAQKYFRCDPIQLAQQINQLLDRPGRAPVAVAIDHPWTDGYQAAQAILAGASFVGVGSFLADAIPAVSETMNVTTMDTLASDLLGRGANSSAPLLSASISHLLKRIELNSALSLFSDQLRSALECTL